MAASAVTILVLGRDLTFWSDELDWLTFADDFAPAHLLTPHNSHLIATTRVIYEGLPRIFGADYLPFRILGIVSLQACAVLVFVLVRNRLGAAVAVLPAVVLLFFGSAQDMFISPLGIPFTLSIGLGLGAFVAVERRTLGGDLLAMSLVILSMLSHTFGAIVAIGLVVYYGADRGRRRELWVPLVPLALWIAWWVWARQFDQGITSASNLLGTPPFLVEAAGSALESMLGIPPDSDVGSRLKIVFELAAVAGAVLVAVRLATGRATAWTWTYLATLLAFWAGIGLAEGDGREPDTPRYLFFGVIMIVLLAAELFRDRPLSIRVRRSLIAAAAVCLAGNLSLLLRTASDYERDAIDVRTQLGALRASGGPFVSNLRVADLGPPASEQIIAMNAAIAEFEDTVGPLGFSAGEIAEQTDDARQGADFVLIRGLGIASVEVPAKSRLESNACVVRRPGPDGYTDFELRPGVNAIDLVRDTGAAGAELDLGRFADAAEVPVGELGGGRGTLLLLPDDGIDQPWLARTTGAVRVCKIGATAPAADGGD